MGRTYGPDPGGSGRLRSFPSHPGADARRDHARIHPDPAGARRRAANAAARTAAAVDASRLAGIGAFMGAFDAFEPDFDVLRSFDRPVYFALGGRGNPDLYARMAGRLADLFSDFTLDIFENRHHFDPPHRAEPVRLAAALREFWTRAESNHRDPATGQV